MWLFNYRRGAFFFNIMLCTSPSWYDRIPFPSNGWVWCIYGMVMHLSFCSYVLPFYRLTLLFFLKKSDISFVFRMQSVERLVWTLWWILLWNKDPNGYLLPHMILGTGFQVALILLLSIYWWFPVTQVIILVISILYIFYIYHVFSKLPMSFHDTNPELSVWHGFPESFICWWTGHWLWSTTT